MEWKRATASTAGSRAISWSNGREVASFNPDNSFSWLAAGRVRWHGRAIGRGAKQSLRAQLSAVQTDGRESVEGTAGVPGRPASGSRRLCNARRQSAGTLPTRVLPVRGAGQCDCVRRIGGTREHQGDGVVQRPRRREIRLSIAEVKWPAGG